ncbi:WD repeat-containing protein 31 [Lamellibrachia satsuma]|nr:WD repeat-containing protein 31 [Lamellibrachia satsuma]
MFFWRYWEACWKSQRNKHQRCLLGPQWRGEDKQFHLFSPVHAEPVTTVAAVGPGICASGSQDKVRAHFILTSFTVALFNFKEGAILHRWSGHKKDVTMVAYADKLHAILSASRDTLISMWRTGCAEPVTQFTGHDLVVTALSPNKENTHLCSGSRDNSIRIWNIDTGQAMLQTTLTRNLITHVKWSTEGNSIVQCGEDKEVRIWDARTLQVAKTFPRKQYIQTCCDLSEDGRYCLSCSNGFAGSGCEATLWDVRTENILHEFKGHHETVGACAFIPHSMFSSHNLIVTASSDCSVKVWDQDTQECVSWQSMPGSGPLTSIALYDDGSICVSSFNTGIHALKLSTDHEGAVKLERNAQF